MLPGCRTWAPAGLLLAGREHVVQVVAEDLSRLADRLEHRAISTLRLISDDDFVAGIEALRRDAAATPAHAVCSRVDLLVFRAG